MLLKFTIVCLPQKLDGFLIELPGEMFGSSVQVCPCIINKSSFVHGRSRGGGGGTGGPAHSEKSQKYRVS